MRDYAKASPQFWIGTTGKKLRGDPEAQVVAFYLISSPHANMLGLYYLPMAYLCHETGLSQEGASKALRRVRELGFCEYDEETEMVWVIEAARFQIADQLNPSDKQTIGISNELMKLPRTKLAAGFAEKYRDPFHLSDDVIDSIRSKALARPLEGPSKPLRSQEQEQEQEQIPPATPSASSVPNRKKKKIAETPLPEDFKPNESTIAWAEKKRVTRLDDHLEHFIGVAKAKGYQYADWQQAFQNAVRGNWAKINGSELPGTPDHFKGAI
ncbi:MAG TPA: hypothetical protein VMV91_14830 [Rhodocyclaceae bacterium]|nr:hypothetical protein [Rhodocyclaceae bacterium]